MMLEHGIAKADLLAEYLGGLLDNRGKRYHVNDAPQAVCGGVAHREAQRRQRLAAAGRHGEGEQARGQRRFGVGMIEDFGAQLVDRRSEEHTSELQSLMRISYAVFCL